MKIRETPEIVFSRTILGAICALVVGCILIAGLWPFTSYLKNDVSWQEGSNGLQFGAHGVVLSSEALRTSNPPDETFCSLEIWLQPRLTNANKTILAFYTPENPASFRLRQYGDDLLVQHGITDSQKNTKMAEIDIDHAFHQGKELFVTITSGAQGTRLYLNGVLVSTTSHWGLTSKNFTGRLVIGTSPVANDSWSGLVRGLAIYNRDLTAALVLRHYNAWMKTGRPDISEDQNATALYLFDEQTGTIVHNHVASSQDLNVPDRFFILHQPLLESPWTNFRPDWSYIKDGIVNVAGFVPFGFFFCAFLSAASHGKRAVIETIILGAAVSLLIEILQSHMPTRDSDMTDVITNTLGTIVGALLYGWKPARLLVAMAGLRIELL